MSAKKLTIPTSTDNSLSLSIKWYRNSNFCLVFKVFTSPSRIIFFIVYELDTCSRDLNSDSTLKACLFGGVKVTKNADPDKYVYSGYGIGFDLRSEFSLTDGSVGKNVIIFGVDMSSSVHIDNEGKDILILVKGASQG